VDVYRQWRESGHIVNWILPWKANTLSVSPFNHSCIAVRASELGCSYDISLIVTGMFYIIVSYPFQLIAMFVFLFLVSVSVVEIKMLFIVLDFFSVFIIFFFGYVNNCFCYCKFLFC